ncbi:hypothetical protein ATI53_105133, partial [Salipiger aestuarii]
GEGEWHARKHGGAKRCLWRKIHLGIDEKTLEVRAVHCPAGDLHGKSAERGDYRDPIGDAPILPDLLSQIPADEAIGSVTADGAHDTRKSVMARDFDRQVAEIQIRVAVLNRYTALGIPVTEAVG